MRLGADGDAPVRRHTPVADVAAHPEVVVDLLVRVEVEEGACWPTGPSAQWPGEGSTPWHVRDGVNLTP